MTELKAATDWQVTEGTLHCELIEEPVTVIVYNDWRVRCTWFDKYSTFKKGRQKGDKRLIQQLEKCPGPICHVVSNYKEKLFKAEGIAK